MIRYLLLTVFVGVFAISSVGQSLKDRKKKTFDRLDIIEKKIHEEDTTGIGALVAELEDDIDVYVKKRWPARPAWHAVSELQTVRDLLEQYRSVVGDPALQGDCIFAKTGSINMDLAGQPEWKRPFKPVASYKKPGKSNLAKNFADLLITSSSADERYHKGVIVMDSLAFLISQYDRSFLAGALITIDSNTNLRQRAISENICALGRQQRRMMLIELSGRLKDACSKVRLSFRRQWRKK